MTPPAPFLASFLQSPEWEQFQRALGRAAWRAAGALVIRHDLPFGLNYLYAPRPSVSRDFFEESAAIGKKERSIFLKIDPVEDITAPASSVQHPACSVQPRETIIIDLTQSEEQLLSVMHEKTRYNIRLAERKGVRITNYEPHITRQKFQQFWYLLRETAARDGFRTHPREYYEKLLAVRSDAFSNELFFAEYQGRPVAAAMINLYGGSTSLETTAYYGGETSIVGTATYLHGASADTHRTVMAPYLLHWRIMQEAKRRGYAAYDLWGIDAERWQGLTRFKKGFGGSVLAYPASVDMIYRAGWYTPYSLWKRFFSK